MAKVIAVLYPDPVDGYPKKYARDSIPKIDKYADGQTAPTPSAIDFKPGELLGSVSGELGLRKFLESAGHTLVVMSSKDGKDS
jgi:formate dehydrogenase